MKKSLNALIVASIALTGVAATPAAAHGRGYYNQGYDRGYYQGDNGYYNQRDGRQVYYDNRGYYDDRGYNDGRNYRNNNYRGDCRRGKGTVGTIIGAVAGGLLGREVGRGGYDNRPSTTGAIIGAGAGALAGRAIDRSGCR
jgi:hypothetical protein